MTNTPTRLLKKFMQMGDCEIARKFSKLPGAIRIPCEGLTHDAVFVPGDREDRVLLVAHTDTVFDRQAQPVLRHGSVFSSSVKGLGIGADNRFGCAALWTLRKSGHSLLLVPDEEIGCLGADEVTRRKKYRYMLAEHSFIMQFDRRGSHDFVTYDCDNPDFEAWMLERLPGFSKCRGSFSDVAELMPVLGIAGCNLSIGFRNEHTDRETGDVFDWMRTVSAAKSILEGDCPAFEFYDAWDYKAPSQTTGQDIRTRTLTPVEVEGDDWDEDDWEVGTLGEDPDMVRRGVTPDGYYCPRCASYFTDAVDGDCPVCFSECDKWYHKPARYVPADTDPYWFEDPRDPIYRKGEALARKDDDDALKWWDSLTQDEKDVLIEELGWSFEGPEIEALKARSLKGA